MVVKTGCWSTLALMVALLTASDMSAGPFFGPLPACDPCYPGPGTYSACHYWFPSIYRYRAFHSGPPVAMYAPPRCPEVPHGYVTSGFRCPYTSPTSVYSQPGISYYNGAQGPQTWLQTTPQSTAPPAPKTGQP